jgi:hypothetical protein
LGCGAFGGIEPLPNNAHLPVMPHLNKEPLTYHEPHPGATRAGNTGFYLLVGIFAVVVVCLFGTFFVATGALQGIADLAKGTGH